VRRSLRGLRFGHVNAKSSLSAHLHRWALCTAYVCAALTLCRFIYPNGKPPSMPVVERVAFLGKRNRGQSRRAYTSTERRESVSCGGGLVF
jgi:hypothetical protein